VGKKASASYKRSVKHWGTEGGLDDDIKIHMAKVGLVSMLVPDIPHHLQNIFGPPQSIKSTYLRHQKSLIDPTTLDLFLPMRSLKDLDKILAQNYFICFDNYFEMTQELSDKICAAITGSGTQIRELFTTQTMVTLYIKACIAFSSVTRLFRQPDALSRLFNFEFLPFAEEEGYDTEDEINSRFEEIKPQILACMYSTLSKAINIRKRIYGMYKLGRMADVLEWSEAISQALDYEPGLYLKRHLALKEIQNKHSLSYDPLVYYYRKIYYDTFVKPADDSSNGKLSSTETNARQEGYIVFTYKELYSILADYAKEDEYDTRKSNTLWPRNSLDLANRTREISILILKTDKFAVEVRQTKSNTNEYVFGTIEGVEEYIQNQEKESNESNSNSSHDSDPDQDLESGQHPDQDIEKSTGVPSTSFPILQKWNTSGDPPYNAPATFDVHSSIKKDHESWKSKIGLVSGSVPNGTVEQWNTPKSGKNKRKISHIGSDCSISGCSKCSIIEKWNTHNMSMRAIAKSLGIGLATVSREIRKWNSQSVPLLKMEHPKVEHLDPKVEHSSPAFFELVPEFKNFAAFDGEWYREDLESNKNSGKAGMLYCFCLINNQGHEARLHLDEFNGHNGRFMSAILDQMQKYDALVGYAILAKKEEWMRYGINGDVEQIQLNCERVGLLERFELVKERVRFLDLHSVFSCGNVKAFLEAGENVKYRGETLDAVATAYLKEGKYGNIKGADAEFLDRKVQLDYCMQDAKLCMKLSQKDYFRVLTIFYNLSKEIGKDFFITCNYAKPTAWWRDFLKPLGYEKVTGDVLKWQEEHLRYAKDGKKKKGVYYNGGKVFEPVAGLYNGVTTYDVSSMYPTMAIVYNISSETINCDCCKDDPDARISDEVMKLINDGLVADGYQARPWHYWICKRRRGIFSNIMKMLYQKKAEYKKQGRILEEKAVKLFANSGYGTFGQVNFEFYDFRLTELVTAFARHTLIGLRDLFEHNNAQVLYGDTDSLFVNMNTTTIDITGKAKEMFHVDLDKDKVWKLLALTEKKKAYFGILDNGKHSHKILPGLKSNYPVYDNEVVSKLTSNEMLKLFLHPSAESRQKAREYVINEIVEAFHILSDRLLVRDMEYVKENLCYSEEASKALYDYEGNCWQAYLFDEILEECNNDTALAKKNSQGKRVYQYWKIANNGKSKKTATMHPERYTLSVEAYKADLWTCVKLILQVYGVPENEISRLHNKLVYNQMGLS
jgi:DNA polymerase elongation subunit (family B)